jgi:hypothetical protein
MRLLKSPLFLIVADGMSLKWLEAIFNPETRTWACASV